MTIETIKSIVDQGAQAFADGKNLEANPYVNNPEYQMHWADGFKQAAAHAEPVAPVETFTKETEETSNKESDTNEIDSDTEDEQVEAKTSKKSKE